MAYVNGEPKHGHIFFAIVLQMLLIIVKAFGLTTISWFWIFLPVWGMSALILVLLPVFWILDRW